jgi:hypothetical protein
MSFNSANIKNAKAGFEYKCLYVIIEAYRQMKAENNYENSWKENKITKVLVNYVKNCEYSKKWNLDIIREYYLDDYQNQDADPDATPRIDMRFTQWNGMLQFDYFIEAKNLCENDWFKPDKSRVSSSRHLNRYINTGIAHFLSGYYPSNGCLCGYILEGDNERIINKLNDILIKKSYNTLKIAKPINNHNLVYNIINNNSVLLNVFLDFK